MSELQREIANRTMKAMSLEPPAAPLPAQESPTAASPSLPREQEEASPEVPGPGCGGELAAGVEFKVDSLFLIGSPVGLFLRLRGIRPSD